MLIVFVFLYFSLVPSSPPTNVSSTNTSSTSLLITWEPISRILINGILLGYRVFHHPILKKPTAKRQRRAIETLNDTIEVVPPNTTFIEIFNLRKFTNYSFQVVGFTSKGDGKLSQTFNVSTDEDSKYKSLSCSFVKNKKKRIHTTK